MNPRTRLARASLPILLVLFSLPLAAAAPVPADESAQTRSFYLQMIHQARADGRARAAIAYLEDFERLYPADVSARLLRINCLLDLGQVDAADAALAKMRGARSAEINAAHGNVAAARGRWPQAVPYYQSASAERPTDPLLRNALGYALLRAGGTESAIEQLRGAADLAPGDAVIRNNLILALAIGGHTADVAAAIAKSGDRAAQASLRRQIAAEVARIGALGAPRAAEGS